MANAHRDGQAGAQAKADTSTLEGAMTATGRNAPKNKETQVRTDDLKVFLYQDTTDTRRPITIETLQDLKYAYLIGSTTVEACRYAGVTEQGYRQWVKNMPDELKHDWVELVGKWQDDVVLQARNTIRKHADRVDTAKWLLERKRRDEYATRVENENKTVEKWSDVPDDTLEDMLGTVKGDGNGTDSTN